VVDEKILVGWFIEKPTRLVKTQEGAGKFEPTTKREHAESSVHKEEILVGASKSEKPKRIATKHQKARERENI